MEENKLKNKLKVNKIVIGILLLILLIILIIILVKCISAKEYKTNNDSNMGMVASGDGYKFYYKYDSSQGGLIKIKGNEEYQIADGQAYSITYDNGYVYYTTINSNGLEVEIKKVNQNGDTIETLNSFSANSTKMYLDDGFLYYITSNPDTISKIDINGENEQVVLKRTVADFEVYNGYIYFTDSVGSFFKVDVNGNNYSQIGNESISSKFQLLDEYVYYYYENENSESSLMKMNLETLEKEVVSDKVNTDIFNVTSNEIYFLNSDNQKICSINLKGENYKEIVEVKTTNTKINILENVLYYLDIDEETNSYRTHRVKVNGGSVEDVKY